MEPVAKGRTRRAKSRAACRPASTSPNAKPNFKNNIIITRPFGGMLYYAGEPNWQRNHFVGQTAVWGLPRGHAATPVICPSSESSSSWRNNAIWRRKRTPELATFLGGRTAQMWRDSARGQCRLHSTVFAIGNCAIETNRPTDKMWSVSQN